MERPFCAHCQVVRVKRGGKKCCSRACYHASRMKPPKLCLCGVVIDRQSTRCRACHDPLNRLHLAKCREKAIAVSRIRTVERRKARFSRPQKKSELWRDAYETGYSACWQSMQRAIQRGDLIVVRERKVRSWEAA